MSATTTERQESKGFVGETLRRPIQEAVREGVREAMQEQESGRSGQRLRGESDSGGSGKFALLALLGIGMAAILLWRRQDGGPGEQAGLTESIRSQSKAGQSEEPGETSAESMSSDIDTGGGAIEMTEEGDEAEDAAPEADSE